MAAVNPKIVVLGSIKGKLSLLFGTLSKLQAKNAFSFAIVAGDLFADPSLPSSDDEETLQLLLDDKIAIPLPTYFTVGNYALPPQICQCLDSSTGEVCQNLYFLGKRSTIKTSEGIRLVTLGGVLDPDLAAGLSPDKYLPSHTEGDAKSLHGANTADILITTNWPSSIQGGSEVPLPDGVELPGAEQCIAGLCATLKPKYHFSTSPDVFFEREPFVHGSTDVKPDAGSVTRFISLASINSSSKAKWLYAFSFPSQTASSQTLPARTTASPFAVPSSKRRSDSQSESHAYSRFANHSDSYRPSKRSRRAPPTPSECFFCLSAPTARTHLVTSIASETYLTTARGPLSTSSTFSALPSVPATHILIIPFSHAPTLAIIPDAAERSVTFQEMQRYRSALHAMLRKKAAGQLGAVTWEVSRTGGIHIHWQFLPVDREMVEKGLVEAAFKVEAENEKYPLFESKEIGDGSSYGGDYFRVWIWRPSPADHTSLERKSGAESEPEAANNSVSNGKDQGIDKSLVLPLDRDFRFDLQFGRRVMAKLLRLEKRFDWRDCLQEDGEEKKDADLFKDVFAEWDFAREI